MKHALGNLESANHAARITGDQVTGSSDNPIAASAPSIRCLHSWAGIP